MELKQTPSGWTENQAVELIDIQKEHPLISKEPPRP